MSFERIDMRTTLDIDDDILMAAKELAKAAHKTAGQIISELVRKSLTTAPNYAVEDRKSTRLNASHRH